MYPLFRSLDTGSEAGTPLPTVWTTLENAGISLYRGDVSMWAGPPGSGKSVLALNLALRAHVPTLYVSCDMGPLLSAVRSAAVLTGGTINDIRREMNDDMGRRSYRDLLASRVGHVYFAHESRPSAEDLATLGEAFGELWGAPPELVVVDNTMNLYTPGDNEWTGLRELMHVFHYLAHEWGSHFMALHHVNLAGTDPTTPAPLGGIKGQITELQAGVYTLAKRMGPDGTQLLIAAAKNRNGKADPSGRTFVALDFDEERGVLVDPVPKIVVPSYSPYDVPDWLARGVPD